MERHLRNVWRTLINNECKPLKMHKMLCTLLWRRLLITSQHQRLVALETILHRVSSVQCQRKQSEWNLIKIKLVIFVCACLDSSGWWEREQSEIETFKLTSYFPSFPSLSHFIVIMTTMMRICVYESEHIMSKHTKKPSSSCHPYVSLIYICVWIYDN